MNAEGMASLQGKRALVSGGTRGMGAAAAEMLAGLGARVIVAARTLPDGAGHGSVAADAATADGAREIAEAVTRELGGVDVIVHCVGASFARPGGALAQSDADWEAALATNLLSAVRIDRELLPLMFQQGSGSVVHVSSAQWKRPNPSSPAYGPAKAALVSSARCSPPSSRPMASGSMS